MVANRSNVGLGLKGHFKVTGKNVELWHADNGSIEPAAYFIDTSTTTVRIELAAHEAIFVVFGKKASTLIRSFPEKKYSPRQVLTDEWDISFPAGGGAPGKIHLPLLASWTENADSGVKYFSGTATYSKSFDVPKRWQEPGTHILLDLGNVRDMAEVYINGNLVDFLWKQPFEVDITKAVKAGSNDLKILVTNEWTNRLLGDNKHPEHKILDSYIQPFGSRQYELSLSGLIGGVFLEVYHTDQPTHNTIIHYGQ
jgi:hypothetical protein